MHTKGAEWEREKKRMQDEMKKMIDDQKRSVIYSQLMQTIQFGTQKLEKTDKDLADAYVRLVNNVVDMGDEEHRDELLANESLDITDS